MAGSGGAAAGGGSGGYGFPSNSRRTYEECDTIYEMKNDVSISGGPGSASLGGGGADGSYLNFDTTPATRIGALSRDLRNGRRNSSEDEDDDFDTGSQKRIIIQRPLGDRGGGGGSRDLSGGGIMVTKQIALSRDD